MQRLSIQFDSVPTSMSASIASGHAAPVTAAPERSSPVHAVSAASQADALASAQHLTGLEGSLRHVLEAVEELGEQRRQSLEELQQVAVELSIAAARWLLGVAIDAEMFAVDDLVRQAVERLDVDTGITVRLHPDDLLLLKSLLSEVEESPVLAAEFKADSALPRGCCRVDAGRQTLLSDMESRLEDIRRLWLESLDVSQIERRRNGANASALRRFPERRETA
jgi:flagellar biosynthesis/type III secretory pathway protein FliH